MASDAASMSKRGGNTWRIMGWGIAGLLLLLPLAAGAPWTPSDFIFMGVCFAIIGLGLELAIRQGNGAYRLGAGLGLAAGFLTIWINGAVGIIGSERDDANLLFLAVVAVALLGAVLAAFRPEGMARAMAAAAIAQILVPPAALMIWPELRASIFAPEVPISTLVFTGLWLAAAALFRKAARPG